MQSFPDHEGAKLNSIISVAFAGTRHYPPSWVGASSLLDRGFWVNRPDGRFVMEF